MSTSPSSAGAPRALVIDDEPGVRLLAVAVLAARGIAADAVPSVAAAADVLRANPGAYAVLVLDQGLAAPGTDDAVRALGDAPIVVVSGDVLHASVPGAVDYVAKPFSPDALARAVSNAAAAGRAGVHRVPVVAARRVAAVTVPPPPAA